jgi:hypothetical protein
MIFQPPSNFNISLAKLLDKSYSKTGRISEVQTSRRNMFQSLNRQKSHTQKNIPPMPLFERSSNKAYKRSQSSALYNLNEKPSGSLNLISSQY